MSAASRSAASVDGEVIGTGHGRSKKAAEQAAAAEALDRLERTRCSVFRPVHAATLSP